MLIQKCIIDRQYCSDSKSLYLGILGEQVSNNKIKEVSYVSYTSIVYYDESSYISGDNYIISCSDYSKSPKGELYINDIKEGDTLYKARNSNEFTIIRKGKKYVFDIDPDRNEDGSKDWW